MNDIIIHCSHKGDLELRNVLTKLIKMIFEISLQLELKSAE